MARYSTSLPSKTITGTTTIVTPDSGSFVQMTGTAPYTVTLPAPAAFPGSNFTFHNTTTGTNTISTPSGAFIGTGGSGTASISLFAGNVASVTSDGVNYVVISEDGSALVATTAAFSGDVTINGGSATVAITPSVLNIAPTSSSSINNVVIGNTTRAAGSFTSVAANNQVTVTAGIASSNTSTGSLVVTGGIGASGTVNAATVAATTLTGTIQTAAQPNIISVGTLSSLNITGNVGVGTNSPAGKLTVSDSTRTIDGLGNLNILTTTAQTTNAGGTLALGGQNGSAGVFDPWSFATLKGAKENSTANDLSGYFAVGTPSSGGTIVERIRVTSNGSVNIGSATNYGGLLSVNRAQSGSPGIADLLTLRDASAGATFNLQTFGDPTFGTANRFNYTGVYLSFRQGTTERLRIDSEGRVTTPFQPHIFGTPGRTTSGNSGIATQFAVLSSRGGLTFSNDRITVPITGVYMIFFQTILTSGSGRIDTNILVNGGSRSNGLNETNTSGFRMRTHTITTLLQAGDFIQFNSGSWYVGAGAFDAWQVASVDLIA